MQSEEHHTCPLSSMPPEAWQQIISALLPKPFRKRHPILFWGGLLLLILLLLFSFLSPKEKEAGTLDLTEDALALIRVKGPILDTSEQLRWIRTLEHNAHIKGVVLRVDSPGGGASASQELYSALARLAKKKPLVVSMGSLAASGGLMVSMAGQRIFANAATITGSIGVRMDIPQVKALLEKIGVSQETLVTGPYKDAGSPLKPLSDADRAYLQGILHDLHSQFVAIIASGRNLPIDKVEALANGRIYTGREAKELGLVDELGDQEDAHAWLAKETKIPLTKKLITKPKRFTWYEELMTSVLPHDLRALLSHQAIVSYQY